MLVLLFVIFLALATAKVLLLIKVSWAIVFLPVLISAVLVACWVLIVAFALGMIAAVKGLGK